MLQQANNSEYFELFLSTAFSDTQLILAVLFLILEKFALCFSSTPALWSRNRGQNGVSDHLSQKHRSLLKIEPLHPFARVDSGKAGKFPSTGSVREEMLIHFIPSWGPVLWGVSPVPLLTPHNRVICPEAKLMLVMHILVHLMRSAF